MPLNSLTRVNLLISLSSCFPCQIQSCCFWTYTLMIRLSEQLLSANNVPSSWRNILECQHHQTNYHLYLFNHLSTADCILDVHLTKSWRCHWIALLSPQQLCSYWKTVSLQWSMVLYFHTNLLLILLLSLRVSFLYTKAFSVRFIDLVALPKLPCGMTTSLALSSTHCKHELLPGMLNVSRILVQFLCCWSLLTIINLHLVISVQVIPACQYLGLQDPYPIFPHVTLFPQG